MRMNLTLNRFAYHIKPRDSEEIQIDRAQKLKDRRGGRDE
jgi:hypothetical protein